jgi:hypothetical protein
MNLNLKLKKAAGIWIFGLLSLLLNRNCTGDTANTNEYWISSLASTNPSPKGTFNDPFDGSSQTSFDNLLRWLPEKSTLHLLPGTYTTDGINHNHGSWNMKSGQRILGSGIDRTIIRMTPPRQPRSAVLASKVGTDMEVADLTCDANYSGGYSTYYGVILSGSQCAIRRVKVINLAAHGDTPEAFGVVIATADQGGHYLDADSSGNIIENCQVSHYAGGTNISAICMNGDSNHTISGIIRNNRVRLPSPKPDDGIFDGINVSYARGILIESNYVEGPYGFYTDTGEITNLLVIHNTFRNFQRGVQLINFPSRANLTFCSNNIAFINGAGVTAFSFNPVNETLPPGIYWNIAVLRNNVGLIAGTRPSSGNLFVYATNVNGLVVAENIVDGSFTNQIFDTCTGVSIHSNLDSAGILQANLNQARSPPSLTRTTLNATRYAASYADQCIDVRTFAAVTIRLPSAAGHPGKGFTIVRENGSTKKVTITPAGREKINGAKNLIMTSGYASRDIISDGTNWFTR